MVDITTKLDLDDVIQYNVDKVICLRFGEASDAETIRLDDTIDKSTVALSKMASFYRVDPKDIPEYASYFGVSILPAMIFFFNAEHMKVDCGTPDHSKWIGAFVLKQDLIDLVETIYLGAIKGHHIVTCPIPAMRIPKYELLLGDV